jgi:perosamine synthetase
MIPVFKPSIGDEELAAVKEVFKSYWIGLGPKTEEFERKFAEYSGVNYAIGTNNGTAALHLALKSFNIGPGDEVILPSLTFISCAHAVLYCGAKPVFADVYADTLTLNINDIKEKITKKTRAIMPVHYGGHPCDMNAIMEIAKEHNLIVIEDAAHACGAEYKKRKIGSISDITCFSFHAVKNLTTGEGGMITTNSANIADILRRLRWLGISKGTWDRYAPRQDASLESLPKWYYKVAELGYKYHMSDIQAAIGIVQLKKLDKLNQKRREIAKYYSDQLSKLSWIETPVEKEYAKCVYHLYVIKAENRDGLIPYLTKNGIAASVHYMPIHLHPLYRKYKTSVPVTMKVWKKLVTLPMFPDLSNSDTENIIKTIRGFKP